MENTSSFPSVVAMWKSFPFDEILLLALINPRYIDDSEFQDILYFIDFVFIWSYTHLRSAKKMNENYKCCRVTMIASNGSGIVSKIHQ